MQYPNEASNNDKSKQVNDIEIYSYSTQELRCGAESDIEPWSKRK